MGGVKVLDGSGSSNVEGVLAYAPVASLGPLASADVSKRVLDGDPFAQLLASVPGRFVRPKFDEKTFFSV